MIDVLYKGKNISEDISIIDCYHEMYAEGQPDTLHIVFDDSDHVWDSWGVKTGDEISVEYGTIKTGKMFVYTGTPQNGLFEIVAISAPNTYNDKKSKAWKKIKLKSICSEIAKNHGLTLETHGVENVLYDYILQQNESDFSFLYRMSMLEGCGFLVYDGKLVVYYEKYMESQKPAGEIEISEDSDYTYIDRSGFAYGSCKIEQGKYKGEFKAGGSDKVYIPKLNFTVGSNSDADRYCKNLLRHANKNAYTGYFYSNIIPEYAAASIATLSNERAPSWDGNVFITRIRNDYAKGKSKIFFRRLIEGDY